MLELGATSSYVRILWRRLSFGLHYLNGQSRIFSCSNVGSTITDAVLLYLMAITNTLS